MGAGLRGQSRAVALLIAAAAITATGWIASAERVRAAGDECRGQNEDVIEAADLGRAERSLLCLVNVHRAVNGVPILTADPRLTVSAREHSADMVERGFYSWKNPEGQTPGVRALEKGYAGTVGENYFALPLSGGVSPIQFFLGWAEDPMNDALLLDPAYVAVGTGFALGTPLADRGEPAIPGATVTQDLGTEPAAGDYTGLDMLVPAECPPAKAALRKAKRKLKKAIATGGDVAKAKRRVKRRKAAARRACNPDRF
jgi:hypothetical protein